MSVFNRVPKNKRYSQNTTSMLDNSISDIKKIYSDFSRKMSFASRTRSQTFDLAEIQGILCLFCGLCGVHLIYYCILLLFTLS